MTEDAQYAVLYGRNREEIIDVKEITSNVLVIADHIKNGYKLITKEVAERLRPQAKGLFALANQ